MGSSMAMSQNLDLRRFHEFKLKFEQRLQQERSKDSQNQTILQATPVAGTLVPIAGVRTSTAITVSSNRVPVQNQPAVANALKPQTKQTQPFTSPPVTNTSTSAPPSGHSSQILPYPNGNQQRDPTDPLSAFKAANNLMESFFAAFPQGPSEVPFFLHYRTVTLCGTYSEQKAKGIEILKQATAHDPKARKRATKLFESANYLKYQEAVLKSKQNTHMTSEVINLVDERFSHERLELKWMETCKSPQDVERQFLADDPLELELLKGFGDQWTAFYRELKMDKAQDYFKVLEVLQKYQNRMVGFLGEKLCVSLNDFFHEDKLAKLELPKTNWEDLKPKLQVLYQELRQPLLQKVLLSCDSEEACVAKAVENACEKYRETILDRLKEDFNMQDLHQAVYAMIKKCFESVPDFKYTKLWVWPSKEPPRSNQYFEEAREERRRVGRIRREAASLLKQLEPAQLAKFWRDWFPELGAVAVTSGSSGGSGSVSAGLGKRGATGSSSGSDEGQEAAGKKARC